MSDQFPPTPARNKPRIRWGPAMTIAALVVVVGSFIGHGDNPTAANSGAGVTTDGTAPTCIDGAAAQAANRATLVDIHAANRAANNGDFAGLLIAVHAVSVDAYAEAVTLQADPQQYQMWNSVGDEFAAAADDLRAGAIDAAVVHITTAATTVNSATTALEAITTPFC